ncbi:M28 family metallopeptidase [Flavobacterium capsici]|uniref:M28 family metallopeptidase n=1 Tax=Flavobacterium capsici TaxID=3075618 RepID=A0AA96JBQ7_9FLAO|nr:MULTISPECIES: M28 family metallopeptidase [unclassified Flavobacterium]WNM18823.1 M28 family metallopeptidase [Flavobacterium sp. PMR2A8]WNM22874.1 M28 family metallopeptidase [Flavobacterium sp. PMTSA4]
MLNKTINIAIIVFLFISCSTTKKIDYQKSTEKFASSISESSLKTNLTIIASDEMEGRETGSEGQKKAGRYIIEQYQKAGISYPKGATSYYQTVPAAFLNAKRNENLPDSENIWAYIEGTDKKDEIVVVSAHYDHVGIKNGQVYNGADDDGSGTVALIEIAKAFQKAKNEGNGPRRSILILHVTGEEHGLHGSRYYSENPLFPLKNTVADVNIDMIGRRDELHKDSNNYVYVIGSDYLSSELYTICEEVNQKYIGLNLDYKYNDKKDKNRFYYRSDHYNFAKNGIPSVFFFNGVHADYHKASDEVDKIEFDALTKRTKYAFAVAWEIATRDKKLVVDKNDGM